MTPPESHLGNYYIFFFSLHETNYFSFARGEKKDRKKDQQNTEQMPSRIFFFVCNISRSIAKYAYRTRVSVKHESYSHCIYKQRKFFFTIHKQRSGCVVDHPLAMQTTWVEFSLKPQIFFISYFTCLFLDFWATDKMIFHSQPMMQTPTPMPKFLQSELFNAIALTMDKQGTN